MARRFDVQYISAYTDGNAARKLELPQPRKTARKHTSKHSKRIVLQFDPVAIMGILVACVMMVFLAVGTVRLLDARKDMAAMDAYVHTLRQENASLQEAYDASYDIEQGRQTALALGMIPQQEATHISIEIEPPVVEEQITLWQRIGTFLTGLFA